MQYKIYVKLRGSVVYHGNVIQHSKTVNLYDDELIRLVEQKLVKVKRVETELKEKKIKKLQ